MEVQKIYSLFLVVLVSTMVLIQTAHATCVSSPNGKGTVCSGGGDGITVSGANSCSESTGNGGTGTAESGPSGSISGSTTIKGAHTSTSHNFAKFGNCADKTCFGSEIGALW